MSATNPISTGYAAIWAALNGWPAFALVKSGLGTQQNAQTPGFSPETTAQPGDRPAVRLLEGRSGGRPYQRNSKVVEITIDYPLQILTDVFVVDRVDLLEAIVMQALMNADPANAPGTLGTANLYKWEIKPGDFKQFDPRTKRPGWTLALTVSVTFVISRAEFLSTVYT
jgi:hypothetical protein